MTRNELSETILTSASNLVAGLLVVGAGYPVTFIALASVAAGACLLILLALPETQPVS